MDTSVAAVGQTEILGLRFWIFAWYVILLVGAMGLVGAWAWGRRTGWRNRDEIVRGFGTIFLSLGMLLLLHGMALRVGAGLVGLATGTFVIAISLRVGANDSVESGPISQGQFCASRKPAG